MEGLIKKWSERRDSNPRQPPWQGGALPTELLSHRLMKLKDTIFAKHSQQIFIQSEQHHYVFVY